jgi:hypothetical protein
MNINPIISPSRKQKMNQMTHLTYTPTETIPQDYYTQDDVEASKPHSMSQNTFSEESVDEAMANYTPGEGEGQ